MHPPPPLQEDLEEEEKETWRRLLTEVRLTLRLWMGGVGARSTYSSASASCSKGGVGRVEEEG